MSQAKANPSSGKAQNSQNKGKPTLIERLKAEITAQSEGQEEIIEFSFESIPIGKFTPEINNLLSKYEKLISLEFNNCELTVLDGFPKIPKMVKLCLEENKLDDNSIDYIVNNFKELQFLSLSNNNIQDLQTLQKLSKLPELQQLDLQENPVSSNPKYREQIFKNCPKLEILDNKDQEGISVQYSDDSDDEEGEDFTDEEIDDDEDIDDEDSLNEDDEDEDDDEDEEQPKKKQR